MNKDQFKGKVDNLKGRAKEAAGALSGDKKTQAEGFGERVGGAVREKAGEIKEDVSRKLDRSDRDPGRDGRDDKK